MTETREKDKFDHQSMDALVWAREFCRLNIAADEGVMLAWFASAIMAGFDEATRRAALSPPSAAPAPAVPLAPTPPETALAEVNSLIVEIAVRLENPPRPSALANLRSLTKERSRLMSDCLSSPSPGVETPKTCATREHFKRGNLKAQTD